MVQVEPIKPVLKAPGYQLFRPKDDKPLLNVAFKFYLPHSDQAALTPAREHLQATLAAPSSFNATATCADYKVSGGLAAEGAGPAMVVAGARQGLPLLHCT
jgi:hypothetical protein